MKNAFGITAALLSAMLFSQSAFAQGCSDAGICTVPSLRHSAGMTQMSSGRHELRSGLSVGKGEHGVTVVNGVLQYGRTVVQDFDLDAKMVFASASGPHATVSALADITVSGAYRAASSLTLTAGLKIPLSDGNSLSGGRPLPMEYQPGLGTFDAVIGASYRTGDVRWTAAFQQPLRQNNNRFDPMLFAAGDPLRSRISTAEFRRAGDVMLRTDYALVADGDWNIAPGLIAIYHLADDTFVDPAAGRRAIAGSQGLTLNAVASGSMGMNGGDALHFNAGFPLLTRTVRPDGLTRAIVVSFDYQWIL